MNDKTQSVTDLVAGVLELPPSIISAGASMDTIPQWDSLAQLSICMLFQERFNVVMDMQSIAEATSVSALVALLP